MTAVRSATSSICALVWATAADVPPVPVTFFLDFLAEPPVVVEEVIVGRGSGSDAHDGFSGMILYVDEWSFGEDQWGKLGWVDRGFVRTCFVTVGLVGVGRKVVK